MSNPLYIWYLRQRLSTKLVLPSLLILMLLCISGGFIFYLTSQQRRIQSSYNSELASFKQINTLTEKYSSIQASLYKSVTLSFAGLNVENASADISTKVAGRSEMEQTINTISSQPLFTSDTADFRQIAESSKKYFSWVEQVVENLDDPTLAAANMVTTETHFVQINRLLGKILLMQETRINKASASLQKNLSFLIRWQIISTLLIAGIAIGISLINLLMFKSFVKKMKHDVHRIAQGDLSHVLTAPSGDELGELSISIEQMRATFSGLIGGLKETSQRLSGSSVTLSDLSGGLMQDASKVNGSTAIIAASGQDVYDQSQRMTIQAQSVSQNAAATSTSLDEIQQSIQEISRNCAREASMAQTTATHARKTLSDMSALSTASREIGAILEMINTLADKTRLLALNATIEAASAGDAGRGFAVVAQEVKNLAGQSTSAASQIQDKITAIQNQTSGAIAAVTQINETIQEFSNISGTIAAAIEEQTSTVTEIARSVQLVSRSSLELGKGVDEVAARNHNMLQAIKDVQTVASGTSEEAANTSRSAEELKKMADRLSADISRFTI